MNQETRKCNKCSKDFTLEPDDFSFYEKMQVPAPKVCPDCRFKMRALFRNEMTLYTGRKCDLCGENIVTMYNPKSLYKVYCIECYQSDKWDSREYAMVYDFNRLFFDQLKELLEKVPKAAIYRTNSSGLNINSEYVNMSGGLKNCYLVFNSGPDEECMYMRGVIDSTETVDAYFGTKLDQCYEVVNAQQCSKVFYGKNAVNCVDCFSVENLRGCIDCFGCINLNNKSHYFFNQLLAPEEYRKRVSEVRGSYKKTEEILKKFEDFAKGEPHRASNNIKVINSTGDYLFECKNVKDSFEVAKSENCRYLFSSKKIKDSLGTCGFGFNSEMLLESTSAGFSSRVIGSYGIDESRNIEYSFSCYPNNHNLLGCDSLKNSSYCILNKQYSKEEYEKIKEHIIKELTEKDLYGLIIPPKLAPFAYNETVAQDNMPLTKEEALALGFRWEDDIQKTEGRETMKPEEIPDHIKDVSDSITGKILRCIDCNRNYKIIEKELLFYRKMILPIPRKCFYCRHRDRITRRGPYKFWERNCAKCNKEITTNYAPDRPEIVFCVECYQQEVY